MIRSPATSAQGSRRLPSSACTVSPPVSTSTPPRSTQAPAATGSSHSTASHGAALASGSTQTASTKTASSALRGVRICATAAEPPTPGRVATVVARLRQA